MPAALALALEIRALAVRRALVASTAAAGLVLAVVHPTYAIFLWIPFVGFLVVRALWEREDLRTGVARARRARRARRALHALAAPDRRRHALGLARRATSSSVRSSSTEASSSSDSDTSLQPRAGGVHPSRRRRDRGAAPHSARRLRGAATLGGVRRRRLARRARGDARAVPLHVAGRPRLDLAGPAGGRVPPVRLRLRGRDGRARAARRAAAAAARPRRGMFLQIVYPGDFDYVLRRARARRGSRGSRCSALRRRSSSGFMRRRPALESGAALAAAALPHSRSSAVGSLDWKRPDPPEIATLSPGSSTPSATRSRPGRSSTRITETSFRLAAFAPVYIAVAPPGHVADTEENRPYERARDARRFLRTGDLSIPRGYGAEYVVVDGLRSKLELDLPGGLLRTTGSRSTGSSRRLAPAAAAGRLDPEEVAWPRGRGSR